MGAVLGLADMASMGAGFYYGHEGLNWAKRAYGLDQRALSIDILNTVREDMRDLFQARATRLDNLLVVITLMITVGFGFVVEGTFPPAESDETALCIYACLCGLSLVCPFWGLVWTLECKAYLDNFLVQAMRDMDLMLMTLLENPPVANNSSVAASSENPSRGSRGPRGSRSLRRTRSGSPPEQPPTPPLGRGPARGTSRDNVSGTLLDSDGRRTDPAVAGGQSLLHYRDLFRFVFNDFWQEKCELYYRLAQAAFCASLIVAMSLCCVLLGLYYRLNYDSEYMWRWYVGVVGLNVCLACVMGLVQGCKALWRSCRHRDHPTGAQSQQSRMQPPNPSQPLLRAVSREFEQDSARRFDRASSLSRQNSGLSQASVELQRGVSENLLSGPSDSRSFRISDVGGAAA